MNRKSYADLVMENYVTNNRENSDILTYDQLYKRGNIESCFYDELPKTNIKGFPFASAFEDDKQNVIDYDTYLKLKEEEKKNYRLKFYYLPLMHELYIGTTGSGKTTTCIEPQLRAITSQKNKPSVFVSDPKGEIFLHNAKHLKEQGYNVQVLNFKNIKFSNSWNPLEELYEKAVAASRIGVDAQYIKGNKVKDNVVLMAPLEEFKEGYHIVYDDYAFPTYKSFKEYIDSAKYIAHATVSSLVNQLCSQMFPEEAASKDPTWSNGAREFFNGIMLALLDDAVDPDKHFTKEMFNIKTINDVYTLVSKYDCKDKGKPDSQKYLDFIKGKSKEATDKIEIVSETADSTKKGFLSTGQSMIGKWMNGHIFSLTMNTNISLDDSKGPLALFIITRDYDKSDNVVAGLFLNWVYRQFLEKAEREERKDGISGGRAIHFLLDEFANIPAIPDFEVKIATSRSRNIWFHIYLQAYEQLNNVYTSTIANIIIDNCNQTAFLGSQSIDTKERFSRECGQRTIKNNINNPNESISTLPVLTLSDLNNIESGYMYIKRNSWNVIESTYIRSYQCAKEGIFKDFDNYQFVDLAPKNQINPSARKYAYEAVVPEQFLYGSDDFLTIEEEEDDDDFSDFFRKRR